MWFARMPPFEENYFPKIVCPYFKILPQLASDKGDQFILLIITEIRVMFPQKSRDYFACLTI